MPRYLAMVATLPVLAAACAPPAPPSAGGESAQPPSCEYRVHASRAAGLVLDVEARCSGAAIRSFVSSEPAALPFVVDVTDATGAPLQRSGRGFAAPPGGAAIRYRVALEAMGEAVDDFDVALSLGGAVVTPVSAWALRPSPTPNGAPIDVHVTTAAEVGFESALAAAPDGARRIESHELRVGTYSVFGAFDATAVDLPGPGALAPGASADAGSAQLRVVRLRGPTAATGDALERWVAARAQAVAEFWHGFPVDHAMVVLVPVRGRRGTVFGKVLPAGGAGVVMLVGARSSPADLDRDWVLVHELFHLGTPSYVGEGKWLDEGLATYFEPIIRHRAGWLDEPALWRELAGGLHQGLDPLVRTGLERPEGFRGMYWGGALVALAADVRARSASGGRLGLEDGLRAVAAHGGTADQVWSLSDAVRTVDAKLGAPVLGDLVAAHARRGSPFDLNGLLAKLGIELRAGDVALDDTAPLAAVRRAIASGGAPAVAAGAREVGGT